MTWVRATRKELVQRVTYWQKRAKKAEKEVELLKKVAQQRIERLEKRIENLEVSRSFIQGDYEELARRRSDEAVWSNGGGG